MGAELSENKNVDLVSFTGGVRTDRILCAPHQASETQLGFKEPHIIFADANIELAVDFALNADFFMPAKCARRHPLISPKRDLR